MIGRVTLAVALLWLGQAAGPIPASAPVVRVRVIDARNGKAYANLPVFITLYRRGLEPTDPRFGSADNIESDFKKTTNAKGEVSFVLPSPIPARISAEGGGPYACGDALFDTEKVLNSGVVGSDNCKGKLRKMRVKFEASPGEIIVFARPFSFWDGIFDAIH